MALDLTTPQIIAPEFNDRLAEQLLLQPDAEYIFARHAYGALAAAGLQGQDGFDLAMMQLREGRLVEGSGGPANLAEAMSSGMGGPLMVSMGVTYPEMVRIIQEARQPGEVIKINRPNFIDGDTTASKRAAGPTTKLFGTNSQAITMGQVALTIVEYLGPTDASGNLSPISLPRFTQHRSAHDLIVDVGYQLRRDRYRFLDDKVMNDIIAACTNAVSTQNQVTRPTGMTQSTDYTGAGNEPMSFDLVVGMGEQLGTRKIPGIGGLQRYLLILDIHQMAQLKLDPQYQRLSVFEPQWNPLFPGYARTVENMIVCVSNRMPRLTGSAALGAGATITGYQGIAWAPGAYGWGSAQDAIPLRNRNDDGGRNNEFGWSAYEGMQVLDERFFQLVITD